jgi:hypothetical protein
MKEMGEIVANAYRLASYAQFLVMEMQRQDKELEISAEKWKEGMGLLKEVMPKIVKKKLERLEKKLGLDKDERDEDEGEKKKGEKKKDEKKKDDDEGGDDEEIERDENGRVVIRMAGACRDFGSSIEPGQWAKLRKALESEHFELFEKVVGIEEGRDDEALELVLALSKVMDRPSIKLELGMIFTAQQVGVITSIVKVAYAKKEEAETGKKGAKDAKSADAPPSAPPSAAKQPESDEGQGDPDEDAAPQEAAEEPEEGDAGETEDEENDEPGDEDETATKAPKSRRKKRRTRGRTR